MSDLEDFFEYYEEAIEVNEPEEGTTKRKKTKEFEDIEPNEKKPKKVVQNPRPKLDVERLLDEERGLPELMRMVGSITFKEGREIDDMRLTMSVLELWSHRLFPKYTFSDFLTKCEQLGKKRPIKTTIRRSRLGQS